MMASLLDNAAVLVNKSRLLLDIIAAFWRKNEESNWFLFDRDGGAAGRL